MRLEVVKHEEAKRGFVLLPRRLCRGAGFRMGIAIQAVGEGLRETTHRFGGVALRRLRLPLPPSGNQYSRRGSITRSRYVSASEEIMAAGAVGTLDTRTTSLG